MATFSGKHPHSHTVTHAACAATDAAYASETEIETSKVKP